MTIDQQVRRVRRRVIGYVLACLAGWALPAWAQTPLTFDIPNHTQASAQMLTYRLVVNGQVQTALVAGCGQPNAVMVVTCSGPLPTTQPNGVYQLALQALYATGALTSDAITAYVTNGVWTTQAPPPPGADPNCKSITLAGGGSIVDRNGATWTIASDRRIMRRASGAAQPTQVGNGTGTELLYFNNQGSMATLGTNAPATWWQVTSLTGTGWNEIGARPACGTVPPPVCTFSVGPPLTFSSNGGTQGSPFTTQADCSWTATDNAAWLSVTGSGVGPATLQVTAEANTLSTSRSATITAGGQPLSVTQDAAPIPLPVAPRPLLRPIPDRCDLYLSSAPPDTRTGWGVQFYINGTPFDNRDTTAPYERTATNRAPGTYTLTAVWSRTGLTLPASPADVKTCPPTVP